MRKAREAFIYHQDAPVVRHLCQSFFNGPWPGMSTAELDALRDALYENADFAGLDLVAFSLQPSSIALVVDVPASLSLSKKEMIARFVACSPEQVVEIELPLLKKNDPDAWRRLRLRFGALGPFMKQLKQAATYRYHRQHGSSGTLWTNRYDSVFLQPGETSQVITAWFDHASVRSGRTESPAKDRHCTYGAAVSGDKRARDLIRALHMPDEPNASWAKVSRAYRKFIKSDPLNPASPPNGRNKKPLLTRPQLLLSKVPHFLHGIAIGDQEFIDALYEINSHEFTATRKTGARWVQGQNDPNLWTFRNKGNLLKPKV